jgi:hypothetical protein
MKHYLRLGKTRCNDFARSLGLMSTRRLRLRHISRPVQIPRHASTANNTNRHGVISNRTRFASLPFSVTVISVKYKQVNPR